MAAKSEEKRGNHPANGTDAFAAIADKRGFREVANTEEERKENEAARKRKYKEKKRAEVVKEKALREKQEADEPLPYQITDKIEQAVMTLKYDPKSGHDDAHLSLSWLLMEEFISSLPRRYLGQ